MELENQNNSGLQCKLAHLPALAPGSVALFRVAQMIRRPGSNVGDVT